MSVDVSKKGEGGPISDSPRNADYFVSTRIFTETPSVGSRFVDPSQRRLQLQREQRLREWLTTEALLLPDHDVLEMVLMPVSNRRRTRLISSDLLRTFGSFSGVLQASAADLLTVEGVGEADIVALKTVRAAALHILRDVVTERISV